MSKNKNNKNEGYVGRGALKLKYAIEQFGKEHFSNCLKINLEEQKEFCSVFSKNNAKTLITELSLLLNTEIVPGDTLFFIDEIQACPEAIIMLRYFYEQMPKLHVVAAGSLLDHALSELKYSMPVGRIEFLYLYPLNYKEFLTALGEENLLDYLKSYQLDDEYSNLVHLKLLNYLRLYFFIGGMPEAVKEYASEKKLTNIERIQSNILTSLRYDFAKYGTRKQQEYLADVLQYSAKNIGKKVKYVNINKDVRSINLKEAFRKLELSRIVHLVQTSNSNGVPLSNLAKEEVFKPLFFDIGLVNRIGNIQLVDIQELITINEGALAEQFIGQELICLEKDYIDVSLYYWLREKKNANAEIDYLYQYNNKIFRSSWF